MRLLLGFAGYLASVQKLWMLPLWVMFLVFRIVQRGARREQPSASIYSLY